MGASLSRPVCNSQYADADKTCKGKLCCVLSNADRLVPPLTGRRLPRCGIAECLRDVGRRKEMEADQKEQQECLLDQLWDPLFPVWRMYAHILPWNDHL